MVSEEIGGTVRLYNRKNSGSAIVTEVDIVWYGTLAIGTLHASVGATK